MLSTRMHRLLDANHVKYQTIAHLPAHTAQEIAAVAHVPGREFAKTVIVSIDGRLAMVVQNAKSLVPLGRIKAATGARDVHLASEHEFENSFPDCERGAMPPFGNLYGMDVFVTQALAEDDEITFNAGSHTELVRLGFQDFARLVHPILV